MKRDRVKEGLLMLSVALIVAMIMIYNTLLKERSIEVISEEVEAYETQDVPCVPSYVEYEVPSDFKPIECCLDDQVQEFAYYIAKAYNIDFTFMMAVMSVESEFDYTKISSTGDYGLMQINKCNHKWLAEELGITDFLDPYQNIIAGTYVMAGLFEKYEGNLDQVLMAYNMGEAGAQALWNRGIYETNYTKAVFDRIAEMGASDES